MKRKIGKEPDGGSKKRKEVENDNSLASMFRKQKAVCDLNKARLTYNSQLQKGNQMGLGEAAQAEPVRRSENNTHPIAESDTVDANGCNSAKTKCGPELCAKTFRSGLCL